MGMLATGMVIKEGWVGLSEYAKYLVYIRYSVKVVIYIWG